MLLAGIVEIGKCTALRISELEETSSGDRSNAHVFGKSEPRRINKETAVCVCIGHMRLLIPTAETEEGEWLCWRSYVRTAFNYDWDGVEKVRGCGESPSTIHSAERCGVCGVETRIPNHACLNPISGGDGGSLGASETPRWDIWNHWIYQQPDKSASRPMPISHFGRSHP